MHQIFIDDETTQSFVTHQKANSDFNAKTKKKSEKVLTISQVVFKFEKQ